MIIINDKIYEDYFLGRYLIEDASAITDVSDEQEYYRLPLIFNRYMMERNKLREYKSRKEPIMVFSTYCKMYSKADTVTTHYLLQNSFFAGEEGYLYIYELVEDV